MENAKLKGQLVEPVLEQTLLDVSTLRAQAAEIDARSDAVRRATADRTLRSEFVEALLDRLHSLPTAETFARQRQARSRLAAATFESNLRNARLLAQVSDLDVATTLAVQATGLPDAEAVALRPAIRQQLAAKRELLIRLDEQEKALLRSLREAAEAEQAVLARSAQARDEAIRLLVWIPLDSLGPNSLVNLRLALEWALSPGNWRSTGELLLGEAAACRTSRQAGRCWWCCSTLCAEPSCGTSLLLLPPRSPSSTIGSATRWRRWSIRRCSPCPER